LPTLASAGLDTGREAIANAHSEERASCLFVRRILDTMRQASHCFSSVSQPSPPPPPPNNDIKSANTAIQRNLDRQSGRGGERFADGRFYNAPQSTDEEEVVTRAQNALVSVKEQIKEIGEAQPILRSILDGAIQELEDTAASGSGVTPTSTTTGASYTGRRLLVRREYVHTISGALSTHPVQGAVGIYGIPGVTQLSCEALCEAATRDVDTVTSPTDACYAYAFRRDYPFSKTDLTGHCWLLQNAGACKSEDFGTELFTRNIESEQVCNTLTPGNDAVMCIGLPATNPNTMVLSHADAVEIAAATPTYAPAGSGGLPLPRTTVEAMCKKHQFKLQP
jgi:hypothetical protein